MGSLLQDVDYTFRGLRKTPGFTLAAVLTLALGMGANTVMFSVLNTVVLRPLPYPQAERLVEIWETDFRRGSTHDPVSAYDFLDWQNQSHSFEAMATYDYNSRVLNSQEAPARLSAILVSAGFFDVFKVPALAGRTFLPGEDDPGKSPAAVLSYSAWFRYFGGAPDIVGKSITLDDQPYSVVGVMPAGFGFPHAGVEVWCLPGFDLKQHSRRSRFLEAVGRLKPGVSVRQAQAEISAVAEGLGVTYHQPDAGVRLVPLRDELIGNAKQALWVLWAAVLAVLLIACANVAGLLLARAVSRQREVAIRRALGVGRLRLISQFLTESLLLAMMGGALGLGLSYSAGRLVVAATNGSVPRLRNLQIDGWVFAFTAVVSLATGLLFGLAPALNALGIDIVASLKEGGAASQGTVRLRLRGVLVVAEVAVAMALLVAGGLLAKTLWRLEHVDTGFDAENVLTFRFSVPQTKYPTSEGRARLYQSIAERLAAIPGVEQVGATNDLPFAGSTTSSSFDIEGRPADPNVVLYAGRRAVTPGYFSAMQLKLVRGRELSLYDTADSAPVVLINQALTSKYFPNQDPLGKRLRRDDKSYEIVGIVGDVKHESLGSPAPPEMYFSLPQVDVQPWTFYAVRSSMDMRTLSPAIREVLKEVAPGEPINRIARMTDLLDAWMSPQKFNSLLLAIMAGLALTLAAIGIYGVIAYSVVQRTREIGIRAALGADRGALVRLILGSGFRVGILGLAAGTVVAYLTSRALSSMLFGVDPHDPEIFLATAASLALVILLASYMPARRAMRVDPVVALRSE